MRRYLFEDITAAAALSLTPRLAEAMQELSLMEPLPPLVIGQQAPIHRRGRFKRNARLQAGRKVMPRRPR